MSTGATPPSVALSRVRVAPAALVALVALAFAPDVAPPRAPYRARSREPT